MSKLHVHHAPVVPVWPSNTASVTNPEQPAVAAKSPAPVWPLSQPVWDLPSGMVPPCLRPSGPGPKGTDRMRYNEAVKLVTSGQREEAIAALDDLLSVYPDYRRLWRLRASVNYGRMHYQEASDDLDRGLEFSDQMDNGEMIGQSMLRDSIQEALHGKR